MGVARREVGWWGVGWWLAWILVCVPAGALAGLGLIEFNWGGPPYDGGFMGELVFFGGFLALGQAPLAAFFAWSLFRRAGRPRWQGYLISATVAFSWLLIGFVGWAVGSGVEVSLSTSIPLYSTLRIPVGTIPWLVVGSAEALVLGAAVTASSLRSVGRARAISSGLLCAGSWIVASAVGGLIHEAWSAADIAASTNPVNDAIGEFLRGIGVAENVAFQVIPSALFVPLLYGIPTGLAFFIIRRAVGRSA